MFIAAALANIFQLISVVYSRFYIPFLLWYIIIVTWLFSLLFIHTLDLDFSAYLKGHYQWRMHNFRTASKRVCNFWISADSSKDISSLRNQFEKRLEETYLNYRSSLFSHTTLAGCVLNYVFIFHIVLYTLEINDIRAKICIRCGQKVDSKEISRS